MIQLLDFNQYKNISLPNLNRQNQNSVSYNSSQYPNLKPLCHDTISFSGRKNVNNQDIASIDSSSSVDKPKTRKEKAIEDKSHMGSRNVAASIRAEADYSFKLMKFKIDTALGSLVASNEDQKDKPIDEIQYRLKSESSIMEKACQKKLKTKKCMKEKITDIIGARIILGDATEGGGNKVIDKLTQAVKENKIKILEIENYRPSRPYQYASQSKLNKLAALSRERGVINFNNKESDTSSGYMAIHMLVELKDGFIGELQIIGSDVARLKDIEDLCYKSMTNKTLPSKYSNLSKLFEDTGLTTDTELQKEFMDYTKKAYLHERSKAPREKNTEFLPLPKQTNLSPKLDFNNLAMMKEKADRENKEEQ